MYLYAVRLEETHFVKIGITGNPSKRLLQMQTDSPYKLAYVALFDLEDARLVERVLHEALADQRHRGEWFTISSDHLVYKFIESAIGRACRPGLLLFKNSAVDRLQSSAPSAPSAKQLTALMRLMLDRDRAALIEALVSAGWNVGQIRAQLRGDNGVIGEEIAAARQRLGLSTSEPRVIPVGRDGHFVEV